MGEKNIYGDTYDSISILKWLEVSGVFTITTGGVEGNLEPFTQSMGGR